MNTAGSSTSRHHSLVLRVVSATVAIPIILVLVAAGGWALFAGTLCIIAIAAWELRSMLQRIGYHPLMWFSLATSGLLLLAAQLPAYNHVLLLWVASSAALIWFFFLFFRQTVSAALGDWLSTLAIPLYLGIPLACLLVLRERSIWWTFFVLFVTWAFDTGAFLVGRNIGQRKLAPKISPNKTWEGFWGGLVCAVLVAWLLARPFGLAVHESVLLGTVMSIAATCGDLAESALKRHAGMKDSGRIMPGHGGLLDRLDGLLWSAIVVFVFVQLSGR